MTQCCTPRHISKRNKSRCLYKNLHINFHSTIIHVRQKVKMNQISINLWIDKQNAVHPHDRILVGHEKESRADMCYNVEELWQHSAKCKESVTKGHIGHDPIYMKCPEETNPQRQKADWWLPGVEAWGECRSEWWGMGTGLLWGMIKNILELCNGRIQLCKCTKAVEIPILKGQILWYVNYIWIYIFICLYISSALPSGSNTEQESSRTRLSVFKFWLCRPLLHCWDSVT
jgi:hypothetical protein